MTNKYLFPSGITIKNDIRERWYQNRYLKTYGLNAIDPSLEEAATAFEMTKWEKLKKFELALAMPVIL